MSSLAEPSGPQANSRVQLAAFVFLRCAHVMTEGRRGRRGRGPSHALHFCSGQPRRPAAGIPSCVQRGGNPTLRGEPTRREPGIQSGPLCSGRTALASGSVPSFYIISKYFSPESSASYKSHSPLATFLTCKYKHYL